MNPQSFGALAAVVAVVLWITSRRRPAPMGGLDASAVAALNRAQISLVQQAAAAQADAGASAALAPLPVPQGARQQALFLQTLDRQLRGDTADRLAAIQAARAWGHRATVPLLKRGLRDVSPQVVLEAAQAMAAFRGRAAAVTQPQPSARSPRNVALTR